jgi:ribosomal protein L37AE/L43A
MEFKTEYMICNEEHDMIDTSWKDVIWLRVGDWICPKCNKILHILEDGIWCSNCGEYKVKDRS